MFDCVYSTRISLPLYNKHNGDDAHQNYVQDDFSYQLLLNFLKVIITANVLLGSTLSFSVFYVQHAKTKCAASQEIPHELDGPAKIRHITTQIKQ